MTRTWDQEQQRNPISQLAGLAMTRYIIRLDPLASARSDNVVNWTGPTVQRYLTGDL